MKIAIVSNGYVLGQTQSGAKIDLADIVIRVSPKVYDKQISGEKTDIVVFIESDFKDYKDNKESKWMLIGDYLTDNVKSEMIQKYGYGIEYIGVNDIIERDIRILSRARPTMSCAPTSGTRAIFYAREKFPHDEISIYGFDFYRNEFDYWYSKEKCLHKSHIPKMEEQVVRKFCSENRIKIEEDIKVKTFEFVSPEHVKREIIDEKKFQSNKR